MKASLLIDENLPVVYQDENDNYAIGRDDYAQLAILAMGERGLALRLSPNECRWLRVAVRGIEVEGGITDLPYITPFIHIWSENRDSEDDMVIGLRFMGHVCDMFFSLDQWRGLREMFEKAGPVPWADVLEELEDEDMGKYSYELLDEI